MPPSSRPSLSTSSAVAPRSARSPSTRRTEPDLVDPRLPHSASRRWPLARSTSSASTRAPASMKASVIAVPSPPAPPVNRTFLSRRSTFTGMLPRSIGWMAAVLQDVLVKCLRQVLAQEHLDVRRLNLRRRIDAGIAISQHAQTSDHLVSGVLIDHGIHGAGNEEAPGEVR